MPYLVRRFPNWGDVPAHWLDIKRAPTPFQTAPFLSAWYATLGMEPGVEPLIVEVTKDGVPAALFPLVRSARGGLREIGFADAELTDNGAPLIGPAFPFEPAAFAQMWTAVRQALPPADILRLEKMPQTLAGRDNPLFALAGAYEAPLTRHVIRMSGSYEDYSNTRTTKFRKEQGRVWRVFLRNEGARFEMVSEPSRALMLLTQMEEQQAKRMAELGVQYRLGQPAYAEFFRRFLAEGLAGGCARFGALTQGDTLVGGLLGVSNGAADAFVRISNATGHWTAASPGRLVLEKALEVIHAQGVREVDFSVGDFQYKYAFGVVKQPLRNLLTPLSARGVPLSWGVALRQRLKRSAIVRKLRERLRPRGPARPAAGLQEAS
jgi:CelD/BcsL family acetyltransferase involved in cellulose biosynthesis